MSGVGIDDVPKPGPHVRLLLDDVRPEALRAVVFVAGAKGNAGVTRGGRRGRRMRGRGCSRLTKGGRGRKKDNSHTPKEKQRMEAREHGADKCKAQVLKKGKENKLMRREEEREIVRFDASKQKGLGNVVSVTFTVANSYRTSLKHSAFDRVDISFFSLTSRPY